MKNGSVIITEILDVGFDLKQISVINHEEGSLDPINRLYIFTFFKMIKIYHKNKSCFPGILSIEYFHY